MRTDTPQPIRLEDYRPPAFLIDEVALDFALAPRSTRVTATLRVRRNPGQEGPLVLDGVRLTLISAAIDGRALAPADYELTPERLILHGTPEAFTLRTEVEIDPEGNTALEGLYMSGGRFCTQCEAEGFRKITYFPDRPDVLSRFTVRLEADKAAYPRLLSNGNLVDGGDLLAKDGADGRHFALWNDPFPKPCYLFALVAGELDELSDSFVTMSGRTVDLRIYVDPGMAPRAAYAMDALKRSMRWDEEAFGREYDLDLFMIVAVRDFNFGAMENKGLNIFNSSLLLADGATATDFDYERIESVVAHEYFHNWTGDRITCRDWFQLCLKEGLTVFRDQSFSADQRGGAVQRIKDVRALRARQFAEDAGPLAHPVRPTRFMKIDNFYTATVYDKGAEVIRMLKTLLGAEDFRRGMDLYFERHDGEATTVEAFVACFAEASGRDLTAFFGWYSQAGTPVVGLAADYDAAAGTLDLRLTQATAPTPGQPDKRPLPIPVRLGLLDGEGRPQSFRLPDSDAAVQETVIVLDEAARSVRLTGVARPPVISALRQFSAPVTLEMVAAADADYVLLAADPDLFNRWEAGQRLARGLILARAAGRADETGEIRFAYLFLAHMDAVLHEHGTTATAVADKVQWYDRHLRDLLARARAQYGDVKLMVFSDHGMTNVTDHCNLMARIDALGLAFGRDYAAVYDSTMARFWFFNDQARARIVEALGAESRGHIVSDAELERWGCDFPGQTYGELYFLMKPGVLLHPSFMGRSAPAGMHGFAPEDRDSLAMFASTWTPAQIPRRLDDLCTLMLDSVGVSADALTAQRGKKAA